MDLSIILCVTAAYKHHLIFPHGRGRKFGRYCSGKYRSIQRIIFNPCITLIVGSWYKFGLKAALGIGKEANDDMLAEFTGTKDTVVHAYSGGQLAQMIKVIAVTSSQIGSKSMTLSDDTNGELTSEDVNAAKQKLLGEQIQDLLKTQDNSDTVPFDTGW